MKTYKELITYGAFSEAAYPGNIGFEEMARYFQVASDKEIETLEKYIQNEDWEGFKMQIYKVLGVKLK
jgi:enolase